MPTYTNAPVDCQHPFERGMEEQLMDTTLDWVPAFESISSGLVSCSALIHLAQLWLQKSMALTRGTPVR